MELRDRVAVVTGGGSGIGRATAVALRAAGAAAAVVDLDEAAGTEAAAAVEGRFVRADVTIPEDFARVVDGLEADVLVNNAGGVRKPCFPDAPPERWNAVLDLNLRAPMLAIQAALPAMRRRVGGAIVNVASTAGSSSCPIGRPSTPRRRPAWPASRARWARSPRRASASAACARAGWTRRHRGASGPR